MSTIADRLATAKAESATEEQTALVELARRLQWISPAGISARDLWQRLGGRGDVGAVLTRLRSLEEQGKARQDGELWYHASASRPALVPQALAVPGVTVSGSVDERRSRILAYLREHPEGAKASEVVRALDLSQSTTHNDLMRMQVEGATRKDHNGLWRIAPPAPPPSQIAEPAPCTEEAPPPPATTVEIVAEGEVVAVVPEPAETETELRIGPDIDDERGIGAQRRYLRAARRLLESVDADLEQLTAPLEAEIARLRERLAEEEAAYRAVEMECEELRAELERVRAALRTLAAGGGS